MFALAKFEFALMLARKFEIDDHRSGVVGIRGQNDVPATRLSDIPMQDASLVYRYERVEDQIPGFPRIINYSGSIY